MHILVTGSDGFIGKNLLLKLREVELISYSTFTRANSKHDLIKMMPQFDAVVHLAGVNRPSKNEEFTEDNYQLTKDLCDAVSASNKDIPIIFSSSIQSDLGNPYGLSKKAAEECLLEYSKTTGNKVYIYKIPNVFGKWCKPNYNSVVATFCHNIAHDLPINIDDEEKELSLVYIDDVVKEFLNVLLQKAQSKAPNIFPVYKVTLGQLSNLLTSFKMSRKTLVTDRVGEGFCRALYATYISYLEPQHFSYQLQANSDERGIFCEVLKTQDSGQFSFFTAYPGITRGGHYHHTKNEKFLVVAGQARFKFRHILSNERFTIDVTADSLQVIETIPGWVHDVSNTGKKELIVLLWANEIYDANNPDTYISEVE